MAEIFKHVTISDEMTWPVTPVVIAALPTDAIKPDTKTDDEIWQAGFTQGFAEATLAANTQLTQQQTALNQLIENIPKAISDNRLDLATDIADIVLTIVQSFFIHQQQDSKALGHQINHILTQLNDKQHLELSLHPHDLALLQQGQLAVDLSKCQGLRVVADEQLQLGGCLIKSEHGVFDASIDRQIARLKQILLQIQQEKAHA